MSNDRETILQTKGHKDDAEKVRYDLIPAGPLHLLACLYSGGAVKYAEENWRRGISYKRLFSALMRHAWAWMRGENLDPETGLSHMVAVAWCAFGIIELQLQHDKPELDDRFIPCKPIDTTEYEQALKALKAKFGVPK